MPVVSPHQGAPLGDNTYVDIVSAPKELVAGGRGRQVAPRVLRRSGVPAAVAVPWASHEVSRWPLSDRGGCLELSSPLMVVLWWASSPGDNSVAARGFQASTGSDIFFYTFNHVGPDPKAGGWTPFLNTYLRVWRRRNTTQPCRALDRCFSAGLPLLELNPVLSRLLLH